MTHIYYRKEEENMEFITILFIMINAIILSGILSTKAHAHGYVVQPVSRVAMYRGNSSMIGGLAFEPQSAEGLYKDRHTL